MSAEIIPIRARAELERGVAFKPVSYVVPGFFEAHGPDLKYLHGRLDHDAIPSWATRVYLNPEDIKRLSTERALAARGAHRSQA